MDNAGQTGGRTDRVQEHRERSRSTELDARSRYFLVAETVEHGGIHEGQQAG